MYAVLVIFTPPVTWRVSELVFEDSIPHFGVYLYKILNPI